MDDLFALLLLASLGCLIVGLVKPKAVSFLLPGEATRGNGLVFGLDGLRAMKCCEGSTTGRQ